MSDAAEDKLLRLIEDKLDETSLLDVDSFVEANGRYVHVALPNGLDLYYRVILEPVRPERYDKGGYERGE